MDWKKIENAVLTGLLLALSLGMLALQVCIYR